MMTKKQILEKLKEDYIEHLELKEEEEKKGNLYAQAQAYGYLKAGIEGILKYEGLL